MGPKVNVGKKDNAAMINITAKTISPKVGVSAFKVPALSGTCFFEARIPAMAMGPMIGRNLESNKTTPVVIFHHGLLSPSPSKPLPLFAAEEVYS